MTPGHEICLTHPLFHYQASSADTERQHTRVRRVGRYMDLRGNESSPYLFSAPIKIPRPRRSL